MTPLETLAALWVFLSIVAACVFVLLAMSMKNAESWDELTATRWERRHQEDDPSRGVPTGWTA